ncbi:MAG TPA: hypothetical protein PK103_04640 [Elusimicrobiales bacterium]|nr:hypothetical protein [Elusimicrobiales bacterium]HOL62640.1 hypothetical protein [Elusimicrobiales bacterium]
MILDSKRCCALNSKPNKLSFLSVLTFVFPIYLLSLISYFLFGLMGLNKLALKMGSLSFITFRMINTSMFFATRKRIVDILYGFSPITAVIFNTYFNILMLFVLYLFVFFLLKGLL